MPCLRWMISGFLLSGFCAGAFAQPVVSVQTQTYPVQGTDLRSLYDSMQLSGPSGDFLAQTEWNIQWNYRWLESAGHCRLTGVEVKVDITILMPEPVQSAQFSPAIEASWQRFYAALLDHENHHRDYGILAGNELFAVLSKQPAQPCHGFENALSSLAKGIVNKYEAMEQEYDRRTNHGINEGIVLQ